MSFCVTMKAYWRILQCVFKREKTDRMCSNAQLTLLENSGTNEELLT